MADKQPLRVLMIGYGGGEITFLTRLVQGLADAGVQLTVTSPKRTNPLVLQHPNVQRLKSPAWEGFIPGRLLRMAGVTLKCFSFQRLGWLMQQVRREKTYRERWVALNRYLPFMRGEWDVIYFPWNSAAIGYVGLYDLGMPVVVSCRGSQVNIRPHLPGQGDYVAGLRETLRRAAAVHCVSADIASEAQAYGLDPHKSTVIRPAVDPEIFLPASTHPENARFRLVTTGSLIWRKGYEYLLLALQQLAETGVDTELHILGGGGMAQAIRFTAFDLGLDQRVSLHGRVEPGEVVRQLQAADAFVLASLSEGISNAVLEAMSCGLPVVTTDCGGMREAVTDGVDGFVVPTRDPMAMAEALRKFAADPGLRGRMGAAGRARVIADFNLKTQAKDFAALFRSVMDDGDKCR